MQSEAVIDPAIGSSIGRYAREGELGRGAMGVVYLAYDPDLERVVALKVVRRDTGVDDAAAAAQLEAEARAMAQVEHPNVIRIYDVGSDDACVWIAMEAVEGGETLQRWIYGDARGRPRPWREVLARFAEAGAGLQAAHLAGVIHRDFKPTNVLLRRSGEAVVVDFGLAVPATEWPKADEDGRPPRVIGTLHYTAPEVLLGGPPSEVSDQYAFCVALYLALNLELPFMGSGAGEILEQAALGFGKRRMARAVPRRLRGILTRGLALDPEDRWPSMQALLNELAGVPRAVRRWRRVRHGLVAGSVAIAVGWISQRHEPLVGEGDYARVAVLTPKATFPQGEGMTEGFAAGVREELKGLPRIAVTDRVDRVPSLGPDRFVVTTTLRRHQDGELGCDYTISNVDGKALRAASITARSWGVLAHRTVRALEWELRPTAGRKQRLSADLLADELYMVGMQELRQGRYPTARRYFELAIQRDQSFVLALTGLAYTEQMAGQLSRAVVVGRRALASAETVEDIEGTALAALQLASALGQLGSADEAETLLRNSRARVPSVCRTMEYAAARGLTALYRGDEAGARRWFGLADAWANLEGDARGQAMGRENTARFEASAREREAGLKEAVVLWQLANHEQGAMQAQLALAGVKVSLAEMVDALKLYQEVEDWARLHGDRAMLERALISKGEALLRAASPRVSLAALREGAGLAQARGDLTGVARARGLQAHALWRTRDIRLAREEAKAAAATGDREGMAIGLGLLVALETEQGRLGAARQPFERLGRAMNGSCGREPDFDGCGHYFAAGAIYYATLGKASAASTFRDRLQNASNTKSEVLLYSDALARAGGVRPRRRQPQAAPSRLRTGNSLPSH